MPYNLISCQNDKILSKFPFYVITYTKDIYFHPLISVWHWNHSDIYGKNWLNVPNFVDSCIDQSKQFGTLTFSLLRTGWSCLSSLSNYLERNIKLLYHKKFYVHCKSFRTCNWGRCIMYENHLGNCKPVQVIDLLFIFFYRSWWFRVRSTTLLGSVAAYLQGTIQIKKNSPD